MQWLIPATYNAFALTLYYLALASSPSKGTSSKVIYACFVLFVAGILGGAILAYYFMFQKHVMTQAMRSYSHVSVLVPALLTPTIVICNILALSWGGGIAISVVNLNMVLTLLAGAAFLGNKINGHVLAGIAAGVAGISYATVESMKIN